MKKIVKLLIFILIIICILVIIFLYAYFIGTKGLKVREYKISVDNLPDEYHGLKIIQISDIHYENISKKALQNIVQKVNLLKPDIVFFTGDISTNGLNTKQEKEVTEVLSSIKTDIGKYYISGNHDYDYKKYDIVMENCGFEDLNDTYKLIYKTNNTPILIAGISTNLYGTKNIKDKIEPINNYLASLDDDTIDKPIYKILLIHEPDYIDEINYNDFDLILSGHSHNGQVRLPFIGAIYTPKGSKKYYDIHYKLNNTDLYISSGIGTSGIKARLFNKPSFNLYRITKK